MNNKYLIEVPIDSGPIKAFAEINKLKNIGIVLYGGIPDSPFNGGRANFMFDGRSILGRIFMLMTKKQLSNALSRFYSMATRGNKNNIPVFISFTNMFLFDEELTEENLYPFHFLVESSQKYGVKNGVILNNNRLEEFVRQNYGDKLLYISSCTKYVSPDKILTPMDTQKMYQGDSGKYDYIVLTPQDSRRKEVLTNVIKNNKSKIIALCNIFCSNICNCYDHYELYSLTNKRSMLTTRLFSLFGLMSKFTLSHCMKCRYTWPLLYKPKIKGLIKMQLKAGVTHFKFGRGLGQSLLDQLVFLIQEHEKNNK